MGDKMLVLSWKYHNVAFSNIISKFRGKSNYSDVTFACEGKFYPAHKLVLAACSAYFEDMFQHTTCKHPIVVLKDITAKNLEALLSYMYSGVTNISQDDLASLIRAAESLCIKGLAVPDDSMTDLTELAAPATDTGGGAVAKPKRRKRGHNTNFATSQGGDSSDTEKGSIAGECQEALGVAIKERGSSDNPPEPSLPLLAASQPHNTGVLQCTPNMPLKNPNEDVIVKEELPESIPSLCYDGQLDCGPGGLVPTITTTHLVEEVEARSEPQSYPYPMEENLGTIAALQQQQFQQHSTETGMAGSSGIPQALNEADGFPRLEGLNYSKGEMELCNPFNLQPPQFHLSQLGLEGSHRGRTAMLAGGAGRSSKSRSMKVHRCAHCNYSTPWRTVFVRHCRTHSGEKPFTCSFCSFRSSRKSVIKRHCMNKHS